MFSHHATYLRAVSSRSDVKVDIRATLTSTDRALYGQDLLPVLIFDGKERSAERPLLLDVPDDGAHGAVDLHLLETAGETTSLASERSDQVYDLLARVVHNVHLERSARATAHSRAAVRVLLGEEDVLAEIVHDLVFVAGLPPSEGLQQLHLLLDQKVVDHGQVLEASRTTVSHPSAGDGLGGHHSRAIPRHRGLVGSDHF